MQYVWIAVLIAAIVAEAMTTDLVAIWFVPAALLSLVLSFFNVAPWAQIPVFFALGLVLVFSTRPLCRRFLGRRVRTNADALIGKVALVTEQICNAEECGEVKIDGLRWSARTEDGRIAQVGEQVEILEIRGVKLIVR